MSNPAQLSLEQVISSGSWPYVCQLKLNGTAVDLTSSGRTSTMHVRKIGQAVQASKAGSKSASPTDGILTYSWTEEEVEAWKTTYGLGLYKAVIEYADSGTTPPTKVAHAEFTFVLRDSVAGDLA